MAVLGWIVALCLLAALVFAFDLRATKLPGEDITSGLIVIFTAALAGFTFYLAKTTRVLSEETRRMREQQIVPRIDARVETGHSGAKNLDLVLKNEGNGPANKVRFQFRGDESHYRSTLISSNPPVISEIPLIKRGIDTWEAGREFRFFLGGASSAAFEDAKEDPWEFSLEYEDSDGKERHQEIEVDFSLLRGTYFAPDHLGEMSKQLKKLRNDVHSLADQHAGQRRGRVRSMWSRLRRCMADAFGSDP